MALSRIKTWIAEVLTFADLNAEFNNVLTNGGGSLSSPRTANFDIDGYTIILDAAGTSYFQASTQNVLDLYGASTLLFKFDMSVATPVNALGFIAAAASSHPDLTTRGSDTNIGMRIQPKGSGQFIVDAGFAYVDSAGTVDAITATYAPVISALDDGLLLGFEATGANATTTPTFAPNGLTAKTIVKGANVALVAGDIEGDGHACLVRYSSRLDKWVLQNSKYPAGNAGIDLNALTTDATGGATGDFVPFVDVSGANSSDKVTVADLFYNAITNATADSAPDQAADSVVTRDNSASAYKKVLLNLIGTGKQTVWIPAGAMTSRTTNGAASGTTESTTNKVMNKTLDFDTTTQEFAQFTVAFPKGWNEGTVTFVPYWTAASGSGGVVFGLAGVALSDDDAIDTAFGTAVTSTDTFILALDVHVGPESAAITIAGTPAEGDVTYFQINRTVADGSDTLAVDAKLIGIKLIYTINSNVDD